MASPGERLHRALGSGVMEVSLATVLLAIDALPFHPGRDATLALLMGAIACGGAALTAWHPRIGAVISCIGFGGLALLPDSMVGTPLYAPMIVILSCAWHGEFRTAGFTSLWGFLVSLWLTLRRTTSVAQDAQAIALWCGFYTLPWVIGLALRRVELTESRRFTVRAEAQRREIAAELHDNVTHELALITMAAEAARIDPGTDRDAALVEIAARSRRSSAYVTQLVTLLRLGRTSSPVTFSAELQRGHDILSGAGFTLDIYTDCDIETLTPVISNALVRITHEAFSNILRHGDPSEPCEVSVRASGSRFAVSFTNATKAVYRADDLGIIGMRERAEGIDGTLETRLIDGFWSVTVSVPVSMTDGQFS
ncbi:sensor histidine kinase [Acidipropionibacterium jensenii]|uniref:sensor histidine kinase n=1 Tax=Acidipropionibacterium jensenii TaxID=1749 RepID=UPI001F18167B|nr:histidine kinase [Acidipropionibacterium jensenii]